MFDLAKLICSFINPHAAEKHFSPEVETVENTGFYDDLKKIDPKFDKSQYEDIVEA